MKVYKFSLRATFSMVRKQKEKSEESLEKMRINKNVWAIVLNEKKTSND